jgi:tubulin-like protein
MRRMTDAYSKTRYLPALFLGLGGSGVAIVAAIKERMVRAGRLEDEPVHFLGIDLHSDSRPTLAPLEFLRLQSPTIGMIQSDKGGVPAWLSPESPILAHDRHSGAFQHRHIGHLASSMHRRKLAGAIRLATWQLADSSARAIIIASLAGGTGSGTLFDVAAALHEIGFAGSIDAVLLLPQVFTDVSSRQTMFPIAYGTLVELAALESDRIAFPGVEPAHDLFTRVYLHGPWAGGHRELDRSMTFDRIAETVEAMSMASIGRHSKALQANAPASLAETARTASVFSTAVKSGLRLLSH